MDQSALSNAGFPTDGDRRTASLACIRSGTPELIDECIALQKHTKVGRLSHPLQT